LETTIHHQPFIIRHSTSMWPRFCKRGNELLALISRARGLTASMGPRFCKRGNKRTVLLTSLAKRLQWGHAFVSVETRSGQVLRALVGALQWGHAFVSVETRLCPSPPRRAASFNGATLL